MRLIDTVAPAKNILTKAIDGDLIVLSLTSGHYYKLCPTASTIWRLLEGGSCVREICDGLVQRYDAPESEIESDLLETLDFLEREQLIEVVQTNPKEARR